MRYFVLSQLKFNHTPCQRRLPTTQLELLLLKIRLEILPFDVSQYESARKAYKKFGKGRLAAALNLGDCCSYALSEQSGEPLLFNGDVFVENLRQNG